MKANELSAKDLMVGDWVSVIIEGETYQGRVSRIDGDTENICVSLYNAPYGWEDGDAFDDISHIPLIPEILEKNGFVKESRENHGNNLQYCILTDGLWIDISGENFFEGKLEFVHQLQHALRLCGIEETIEL